MSKPDIVERLMEMDLEDLHDYAAVLAGQVCGEAADEIEQLRARLARALYEWLGKALPGATP